MNTPKEEGLRTISNKENLEEGILCELDTHKVFYVKSVFKGVFRAKKTSRGEVFQRGPLKGPSLRREL